MTKAQEVKKALKGHFDKITARNGNGTAYGWVELHVWDKKLEGLEYREKNQVVREKVYKIIKEAKIELYTYSSDDGYGSESNCMLIEVN